MERGFQKLKYDSRNSKSIGNVEKTSQGVKLKDKVRENRKDGKSRESVQKFRHLAIRSSRKKEERK